MKDKLIRSLILIGITLTLFSYDFDKAEGWFVAGSKPKSYEMGIDKGAGPDSKNVASIKSKDKKIKGFGTLMQSFKPNKYLGKRIRLIGYMKSKDVKSWAGFWMRVDQAGSRTPLSFDNMSDRPIKANTEWNKYEIVLDVPNSATNISFGALLDGTGQIWFENLNFEIVDSSIPLTRKSKDEPTNLNFEK